MSTEVTVDEKTVARRYYGGVKRGGMVEVYASDETAAAQWADQPVAVMEYATGETFAEWVADQVKVGFTVVYVGER